MQDRLAFRFKENKGEFLLEISEDGFTGHDEVVACLDYLYRFQPNDTCS